MKIGYITLPVIDNAIYYTAYYRKDTRFYLELSLVDILKIKWHIWKSEKYQRTKEVVNCKKCDKSYFIPKMESGKPYLLVVKVVEINFFIQLYRSFKFSDAETVQ